MNENNGSRKREWVKNAAIIFLAAMLLLTFFSNTIMNYSLPEVSAQYVGSGTLSEQIRGTATVEAAQSYTVKINESRVVASVEVKTGDTVEKGQVILRLEEGDSTQLEEAQTKLETEQVNLYNAEIEYEKMLLDSGSGYSLSMLEIQNLEADIKDAKAKLENLGGYTEEHEAAKIALKAAEKKVKELTKEVSEYDEILTAVAADDYTLLTADQLKKVTAAQDKIKSYEKQKKDIEEDIEELKGSSDISVDELALLLKNNEIKKLNDSINSKRTAYYIAIAEGKEEDAQSLLEEIQSLQYQVDNLHAEYQDMLKKYESSASARHKLTYTMVRHDNIINNYNSAVASLDKMKNQIVLDFKTKKKSVSDSLDKANEALEEAQEKESDAKAKLDITPEAAQDAIDEKERSLAVLKINHSKSYMDIEAKADAIERQRKLVEKCEAEVKKLESSSEGNEITAQVAGVIESVGYVAGETTEAGSTVASIQMTEKGYTAAITVTNDQAKKVKAGDEAEIQYYWYGDAKAVLTAIKPDQANPTRSKQLVFNVTGDVTPGTSLQLVMGGEGRRYDIIVPNSAIREDSNGKFVLAVVSKSSPLGNRYIAKRVDVQVIASDDTKSAVQGELMQSDFIISTSTKPISAGEQVRLVDSE